MTEHEHAQDQNRSTVSKETLAEVVTRILEVSQPDRVIVFGSAASGQMTADSDIDLLILVREVTDARAQALRIRRVLAGLPYPFDVIVMTSERFDETRGVIGGIAWPAAHHGRVIYEAA